jgi:hypothetical protein
VFARYRMPHTIPVRNRMLSIAIGPLAVLMSVSCWPVDAHAGSSRSMLSTVPSTRSSKSFDSERWELGERAAPSESGTRSLGNRRAGPSGLGRYPPERIHRFWSHYHGGKKDAKSKPLEREK